MKLIDENFVVKSVAAFLKSRRFDIEQQLTTHQTGVACPARSKNTPRSKRPAR